MAWFLWKCSDNVSYNPLTLSSTNPALSLALAPDNPPNEVSCSCSGCHGPAGPGTKLIFLLELEEYFHPLSLQVLIHDALQKDQYQRLPFSYPFIKMTEYKLYPNLPSAPPEVLGPHSADAPPQVGYHLNMVQAKRRGLINKEKIFKKKSKKYNRILNRLNVVKCLFEWNKRSHWII